MKLKYSIVKIDSTADDVYVKSYGQDVFEFHKEDFNGDWQNIVGEEFNLDPCASADLSKLEMYGNEAHSVNYSLEDKLNWYTFARNKIRDDFFTNDGRIAEIDTSRTIEIYNKDAISTTSELYGFFSRVPYSKMGTLPKIDLSGLKMSDDFIDSDNEGLLYDGKKNFSGFAGLSDLGLGSYVIKLPNIPRNLKVLNYTFNGMPHLEDISNIDFSNVIKYSTAFYNLPSLKDLSSLDLSNAIEISHIFNTCQSIEHLPRLDNLNATTISEMFTNHTGLLIENAGNINILSEEGTVTGLFENFKIKNIGDINIKGSVTGTLIGACSELKKIGNIELDKIHIVSNSYNNGHIISNCYGNESVTDSILEIGDIHIKENTSTVGMNVLYLPNSPVQVGDIIIDNNIGNAMAIYAINGVVGNVIVHNTDYSINTIAKEVGVVSIKNGKGSAYINNNVKKIKAFPYYKTSGSYSSVNSSGFEYWFDYIKTPNSYMKCIVNSTVDISRHIGTPNKNYKAVIPLSDLISVNPEYPYDFELKSYSLTLADEYSYTIGASGYTKTDITKVNSIKLVKIDDSTIGLDVDLEGIMDGSTISLSNLDISGLNVDFTADIDGVEFYGRTHLKLSGTIDFEITEDISSNFHIEYEEGEEPLPTE